MNSGESILARIREALAGAPSTSPHTHERPTPNVGASPRAWLPRVGETEAERLSLFIKNASDLKAVVHVQPRNEALNVLQQLKATEGWRKVATHRTTLASEFAAALKLPTLHTDDGYSPGDLESCDVAITGCDALVAQTGSVLVTSPSAGCRALSVLPEHHIVVATKDQLLPDLPAAFELLKRKYSDNYPSFISFITGPSRTGDIERILVLGAHGPKKLTILCLS